jgi:tetratricopeptide (TPR) repeat protein
MTDRIDQLKKLLNASPDDAFCFYALALEYAASGGHNEAIEQFDRAIASDAEFCYAYYHKAKSQKALGDAEAALATLRLGLRHAQTSGDAKAAAEITSLIESMS